MPTVNFKINSKNYSVDCGAGQEEQILSIASQIDARARSLSSMCGEVDSETLLLMVCILTFGDFMKSKNKVATLEKDLLTLKNDSVDQNDVVEMISKLTLKIKDISKNLLSDNPNCDIDNVESIIDFNR